jgi:hypothetical protein
MALARHHISNAIKSPYLNRPVFKKNELHYYQEGIPKYTEMLLSENVNKINQKIMPHTKRRIVSQSIEEVFVAFREKVFAKNGNLKRQLLLAVIGRRVTSKASKRVDLPPYFLPGVEPLRIFNPSSMIRVRRIDHNYMNRDQEPGDTKLEVPGVRSVKDSPETSVPTTFLKVPDPKPASQKAKSSVITPNSKLSSVKKPSNLFIKQRQSNDHAFSHNRMIIDTDEWKRPRSYLNARVRTDAPNPKELYLDLWTHGNPRGTRFNAIWSAINPPTDYKTRESEVDAKVFQPGSTLLSFKAKKLK